MRHILSGMYTLFFLCALVAAGCLGFHSSSVSRSDVTIPPMVSEWVGEYGGNVQVHSFEKAVKESYPAHISIKLQRREVVLRINIPNFNVAYFDIISKKPIELRKDIV